MYETEYYVDVDGNYLGGYAGTVPSGGIKVPTAPHDARQKWNGLEWGGVAINPLEVLNAAWLAQTFETSGGHIITVRPPQVNKFDESVYESMIKQIDLGNITEGVVTDVNYIQRSLSKQDLEDALTSGFAQTSANYQTYIDSL